TVLAKPGFTPLCGVMSMLANSFTMPAMLWGGAVAFLIDKRIAAAAMTLVVCAGLSFFGFMHSILPTGGIYLPWQVGSALPYHWTIAYLAFAGLILVLGARGSGEGEGSRL